MDALSTQTAQQAITKLFNFMEIKRVVCVDDEYASTVQVEEFIAVCSVLDPAALQAIPDLASIAFDEEAVWPNQLRAKWGQIEEDTKTQLYRQLVLMKDNGETDTKDAGILGSLLAGHELVELSPAQWDKMKSQLLEDVANHKTLFLFDQNLINGGGSENGGILLIQQVLSSKYSDKVICGLLSSTFAPDKEQEEWNKFAADLDLDRDKFVLISKQRLSEDPLGFARMVKLTVLNTHCRVLKEKVSTVLDNVNREAKDKVEAINIYDFEHIVFHSSSREGVWEPDTLFRVYGLYQRAAARRQARVDAELHALAARIRSVSDISTKSNGIPPLASWKIQRLEMYEQRDYLNSLHMPIELGDIFQKAPGGKQYILLAQPCDLMVRSTGDRHQAIYEVTLAEIVEALPKKKGSDETVGHEAHYELQYFDETSPASRFVSFRKTHSVRLFVLDLCVFQDDGTAKLRPDSECPTNIIPTWKLHRDELSKVAKKAINHYTTLMKNRTPKEIMQLVIPSSSNKNLFQGKIEPKDNSISYDVARIGRLCQPYSGAMLTKYATYIARTAFEHDFGKAIEDEQ